METLQYKGRLKNYLKLPLYMIIVFVIGDIVMFFYDTNLARIISIFVLFYSASTFLFYKMHRQHFEADIIDYAIHYGTVQKELLKNFKVPYVITDYQGKIMWMNDEFAKVTDKQLGYNKSITSIFAEITRESIEKAKTDSFDIHIDFFDRKYLACLQRMEVSSPLVGSEIVSNADETEGLVAILLYDETDYLSVKQQLDEEHMVIALLYVDNYDEVFDSVENAKQSMLKAVIDRRINKYFAASQAIVRQLEKDKYLIIFQNKYLADFEKDRFSLIDDIKSIKMGNEIETTISMGVGTGGSCYTQSAEYSHMAIDIALARGGCQVVIKNGSKVSYYGAKGKEVERNTRVKARVKAQALREIMDSREDVIVMGHKMSDADCLGAAIGVYCAARQIGKPVHIVLDHITGSLRPLIESFTNNEEYAEDMFISSEVALNMVTDRTLVMVVDTNRPTYVECPELLNQSKNIVVIDHHRQIEEVIEGPILSYIEPYASSASEMIAEVLQYFSDKIEINATEADAIYAGILVDTNNFMSKTGVRTFEAAAFLRRNGAEVTRVRKMLRENIDTYKARAEIVRGADTYKGIFAIAECRESKVESPTVVGAQASNELLNIVGIKASFVLTAFNDKVYISSRSIDEIDVQSIMARLGGGGHLNIAGAQISGKSIDEVRKELEDTLDEMIEKGEIKL
ncbi:MAG: DHH family phosphoesterase [Pseudobutyrivibrio sp.]|nr:DHH family phosphoesterase [Pseudobutyrivibrio sp.]